VRAPLSLLLAAVVLAGCGATRHAAPTFETRANAICARMNTSPFLDTKALYDAHLQKTRRGLQRLSSLGESAPNPREFGDLVGSIRASYSFERAHEAEEIALVKASKRVGVRLMNGQPPHWPKATGQFIALVSRQIGGDKDVEFHNAKDLGLDACGVVSTTGTLVERRGE
jgi:hypothetical protein